MLRRSKVFYIRHIPKDSPASVVSTSSSSSNNAPISPFIKSNTRSPLHLSRSSSSSNLSINNTDKKDSLHSKKNSTDSYSTYHISSTAQSTSFRWNCIPNIDFWKSSDSEFDLFFPCCCSRSRCKCRQLPLA